MMTRLRNKIAVIGVFALGCFITFVVLTVKDVLKNIVEDQIKERTKLKLNSESLKNWKDPPVPVYMQYFLFHIENPEEILQGKQAIVREVGPYTYKELRHRSDVFLYDNATISSTMHKSFVFQRNMSVGDPRVDHITTVNIPFVAMLQSTKQSGMAQKMILSLLFALKSSAMFQTHSVEEFLWGYEDPLLKLGHKLLPSIFPDSRFGLFYDKNGSDDGVYLFSTGNNDYMDSTKIITWNGQKSLTWWASNTSNMINGTDGASFHPLIKKNEALYIFAPDICRSLHLIFEKDVQVKGISAYRFIVPKEMFAIDYLSKEGFCPAMNCQLSGVLNISICKKGVPIFISSPHFYDGDQKLVRDISGMKPNMKTDRTFLDIEPMTGFPIRAAKRMQLNLHIEAVDYIVQTGRMRTMILPVIFLNEHAVIDDKSAVELKWALQIMKIVLYIPYIILGAGILFLLISLSLAFVMCSCKENKEYTPVILKVLNIKSH
ncbi:lysosome membrane protein 2-like [Amblyraja radiata]|uniref:lysosome membrane protein 2-like n=1 Tax=Amblyraja radiata TaxID=386614 RepID=UPI00140307C6|nr:lysosome membrane protein 2-like [Amblyraja radiata]